VAITRAALGRNGEKKNWIARIKKKKGKEEVGGDRRFRGKRNREISRFALESLGFSRKENLAQKERKITQEGGTKSQEKGI